ncbi:hypothetical protein [Variovorax sp. HJSM1_2]|uniref:hypothetical protein n=1 Tax=Variovorax sp. HJSM1_2 TaxID=3366263 RepID=UPI003BD4F2BD
MGLLGILVGEKLPSVYQSQLAAWTHYANHWRIENRCSNRFHTLGLSHCTAGPLRCLPSRRPRQSL